VVQRQPWPLVLCGPHHRPRLVATFAIRLANPNKFAIATAALTTSQVLRNISSACIQMRLRPDRLAHHHLRHPRHPRHPSHPPDPHRARHRCGEPRGRPNSRALSRSSHSGWFHPSDADEPIHVTRCHHLLETFCRWRDKQLANGTSSEITPLGKGLFADVFGRPSQSAHGWQAVGVKFCFYDDER
jgi:hypothetical protein